MTEIGKEELHRRLARTRRMMAEPFDPLTKDRPAALAADLEDQIAAVKVRDADTPPDAP